MTLSENGYTITLVGDRLVFSGRLEKSEYADVETFLTQVEQKLSAEQICIFDLTDLSFLNSRGIRTLASFLKGSTKTFNIRINPESAWQQKSIPMLRHLRSEGITIIA